LFGAAAALLVGFSKTGLPGAGLPAVALMADAFRDQTRLSVGAILPILILGDIFAVAYYRRHAQWDRLWSLLPFVVIGMIPGYFVLKHVDNEHLRSMLGAIILSLLTLHLLSHQFGLGHLPEKRWFVAFTGVLAGFATTVGNAAGPVMSIYLVGNRLDKHKFLGTAAWFFLIMNVSKIPFYTALGMITRETLVFDAMLVPIAVIGALLGVFLLKRIPQRVFDGLVLILAGAAGFRLLVF
jgi:uncharacterized protein